MKVSQINFHISDTTAVTTPLLGTPSKVNSPVDKNSSSTPRNIAATPVAAESPATPGSAKNKALSDMDAHCTTTSVDVNQSWLMFLPPYIANREGNKVHLTLAMGHVNYNNFDSELHKQQELTLLGNPNHLDESDCIHRREIMANDMKAVLTPRVKVSRVG